MFPIIDKKKIKNNQASVSNAHREIPASGQRIMPETHTEFQVLSVHPRDWISRSALETNDRFYFSLFFWSLWLYSASLLVFVTETSIKTGFKVIIGNEKEILQSILYPAHDNQKMNDICI